MLQMINNKIYDILQSGQLSLRCYQYPPLCIRLHLQGSTNAHEIFLFYLHPIS